MGEEPEPRRRGRSLIVRVTKRLISSTALLAAFLCGAAHAASVSGVTSTTSDGPYKANDQISIQVAFSSAVLVTGSPTLTLETGASDALAQYASGSGTSSLTFLYTVANGHASADLDYNNNAALALNGGTIIDAQSLTSASLTLPIPGSAGSLSANKNLRVDTTAPTATLSLLTPSVTNTAPIRLQLTFSESVTGLTLDDLQVANGSATELSGSGSSYTIAITPAAQGAVTARLPADSAVDQAGNGNVATTTASATYDTQPPSITNVTSSPSSGAYRATQAISVVLTFSEPVTIAGGIPSLSIDTNIPAPVAPYLSGSGTSQLTFRYTITSGDSSSDLDYTSTNALALNGSVISDAAGNVALTTLPPPGTASSLSANSAVIIDTSLPSVEISSILAGETSLDAIPVTVTFSEPVTGFALSDFIVSNGCASNLQGSGALYTADIVPRSNGPVSVTVPSNAAIDRAGNPNIAAPTPVALTFSTFAPLVTSVTSATPNGAYRAGQSVSIQVSFSEAVVVSGTPQLRLATGSLATIDYQSGSGTDTLTFGYTIASGQNSSDLDYIPLPPLVLNGGFIRDAATENLDIARTFACPGAVGSLGYSKNIVIDTIAPTISRVTSTTTNGAYRMGQTLNVQTQFSEVVYVTGTPTVTLETGANDGIATIVSGSGSASLNFNYTIADGHNSNRLDYQSTTAFNLNGAVIQDLAGNTAVVTLPATGSTNSLFGQKSLIVDTIPPTVTNITSTTANGSYKAGRAISITVSASEPIFVTGSPRLALATGAPNRYASYSSGSGTANLVFSYTVTAGDATNDLDYTSASALELNGGTIRDQARNDLIPTLPIPGSPSSLSWNKNLVLDTQSPTITSVSSSLANGHYGAGTAIPITVSLSEAVTVTGGTTISLGTTPNQATAVYTSGSGTPNLTFLYTVQAGQNAIDLDYSSVSALVVNTGATIRDTAGNDTITTLPSPGSLGSLSASSDLTIDTQSAAALLVSSSTPDGYYREGATIGLSISFNEPLYLTGELSLTLAAGAVTRQARCASLLNSTTLACSYVVSAGDTSADLEYISSAALSLSSPTSSLVDAAGNAVDRTLAAPGTAGSLSHGHTLTIDTTRPSAILSSTTSSSTNLTPIPVSVSFNEVVTGVSVASFTVTNASITSISGSGNLYQLQIIPNDQGSVSITLNANGALDQALNGALPSAPLTRVYDSIRPDVSLRIGSSSSLPTREMVVPIEFTEEVSGLESDDIVVMNGSVRSISGSGASYTLTILAVEDGEVEVTIPANSAFDNAMNGNNESGSYRQMVDTTAPTVVSVTATNPDGAYKAGGVIDITVTLSESTTVTGSPTLLLNTGRTGALATFKGSSNTNVLEFEYEVQAGDNSLDLDYLGISALSMGNSAISDGAGNKLKTTLPVPGSARSISGQKEILIDTESPPPPTIVSPQSQASVPTRRIRVTGTSEPNALINLLDNGTSHLCDDTADQTGAWSCYITVPGDGDYSVRARAEDIAGNQSSSELLGFTVNSASLTSPEFLKPVGGETTELNPVFAGTAPPSTNVHVRLNGVDLCVATVDSEGSWSCTSQTTLQIGQYTITAVSEEPTNLSVSPPTTLALTVGVISKGQVVIANRQLTPLRGVTLSDGARSAQTSEGGTYSLVTTASDNANVVATLKGWRISRASSSAKDGHIMWYAVPALEPETYTIWNTTISSFTPSIRLLNRSSAPQSVRLTLYQADGSECSDVIQANVEALDYVRVPLDQSECLNENSFGLLKISFPTNEYDGDLTMRRGNGIDSRMTSIFSLPLANSVTGVSHVLVDGSYNGERGGQKTFVMRNDLFLSNLSPAEKSFTIRRYNTAGTLVKTVAITLAGFGTTQVQFPYGDEQPEENGIQEIEPLDISAPYVAVLARHGEQRPVHASGAFLFMEHARTGGSSNYFARVRYLPKRVAVQYVEISNTTSRGANVRVSRMNRNGRVLPTIPLFLKPKQTRRLRLSRLLDAYQEGITHISSDIPNALVVNSIIKHFRGDKKLLSMKALSIEETIGDTIFGMYRLIGKSNTALKLINVHSENVTGSVTCYRGSKEIDAMPYHLRPGEQEEISLENCFGGARRGVVEVNASHPGAIIAETSLYRTLEGIHLPSRLR